MRRDKQDLRRHQLDGELGAGEAVPVLLQSRVQTSRDHIACVGHVEVAPQLAKTVEHLRHVELLEGLGVRREAHVGSRHWDGQVDDDLRVGLTVQHQRVVGDVGGTPVHAGRVLRLPDCRELDAESGATGVGQAVTVAEVDAGLLGALLRHGRLPGVAHLELGRNPPGDDVDVLVEPFVGGERWTWASIGDRPAVARDGDELGRGQICRSRSQQRTDRRSHFGAGLAVDSGETLGISRGVRGNLHPAPVAKGLQRPLQPDLGCGGLDQSHRDGKSDRSHQPQVHAGRQPPPPAQTPQSESGKDERRRAWVPIARTPT